MLDSTIGRPFRQGPGVLCPELEIRSQGRSNLSENQVLDFFCPRGASIQPVCVEPDGKPPARKKRAA
jgi:hypothetical protein